MYWYNRLIKYRKHHESSTIVLYLRSSLLSLRPEARSLPRWWLFVSCRAWLLYITVTKTGFESAKCSGRIRVIMVLLDKVSWKVQYGKCAW
eukprot:jgi/Botrbrau1/7786/Bobra.0159s0214.1